MDLWISLVILASVHYMVNRVKNHDLPDLRVAAFCTFQSLKRKTESQNDDIQSLLYLLSLAQSNTDSRVSHANEIVGYYKEEHSKKRRQFEQKACCVCLCRYSSLSNCKLFRRDATFWRRRARFLTSSWFWSLVVLRLTCQLSSGSKMLNLCASFALWRMSSASCHWDCEWGALAGNLARSRKRMQNRSSKPS